MAADRYARQRLIEGWDQERLGRARVLVAGAGALGNEVAKNLALLGVGHLTLVDFDRVEASNLSRAVLFDETDVGSPKVDAAARALRRLNPAVSVRAIDGDLFYDVGMGHYRHSDLAIGCLDNLGARSHVGLCCALAGIPHLDGGMWSLGGEVRWFMAGDGPCFACTLGAEDWRRIGERWSCTGLRRAEAGAPEAVPTVATTASIIGGLLAQEAVKWLCGHPVLKGKTIVFNGQALTMHRSEIARNPNCTSSHTAYGAVAELPERASELTVRRLIGTACGRLPRQGPSDAGDELVVELGRDFLVAVECPGCGKRREFNRVLGRVLESELACPRCRAVGRAEALCSLDGSCPLVDRPLAALGVPSGEVLAVHSPAGLQLYELTADL